MTPIRRTGALVALALTLVLGACSTPADLTAPTLTPQFGTADADVGMDVAYAAAGRVYVVSEQDGYTYDEFGNEVDYLERVNLRRYDSSGRLLWSREVESGGCDDIDCVSFDARTVVGDPSGNSYTLVTSGYDGVEDCTFYSWQGVFKYDAAGNYIRTVDLGATGETYGISTGAALNTFADLAVDGSGNLYVVRQDGNFSEDFCEVNRTNVVAKYSPTGSLLWERVPSVGTPNTVTVSSSGNVFVGGTTGYAKYTNAGQPVWTKPGATQELAAVGTNTVYARNLTTVRKLDANGKQVWSKAQSGLTGMVVADMTTDASANLYLTGKYGPSSNRDAFVRKLNTGGTAVFTKTFGTNTYDDGRGVATINGSEFYVTGTTQGVSLVGSNQGGASDAYLRKFNSSGTTVWTR